MYVEVSCQCQTHTTNTSLIKGVSTTTDMKV